MCYSLQVAKSVPYPKIFPNNTFRDLDLRGAFIVHTPARIYIWVGSRCPADMATTARFWAKLLLKYEHVQLLQQSQQPPIVEVRQGSELAELLALLDPPLLDAESARSHARHSSIAEELASGSLACKPAGSVDAMDIVPSDEAIVGGMALIGDLTSSSGISQPRRSGSCNWDVGEVRGGRCGATLLCGIDDQPGSGELVRVMPYSSGQVLPCVPL